MAIGNLLLILSVWAITTAAALAALMYGSPEWAKVALCWQIATVPGLVIHKIIETRRKWLDTPLDEWSNLYEHAPLLLSGGAAVIVYLTF